MVSAILMMAGSGTRMGINQNKVYLQLSNMMIFEHSIKLFQKFGFEIICVIREEDEYKLEKYKGKVKIVYGGKTRQESVYNGLEAADGEFVIIHDAARPLVTERIINDCLDSFTENKAFLVAVPSKDSIYQIKPLSTIKRDSIVLAQTPQGGKKSDLLECHRKAIEDGFVATDDVSLLLQYSNQLVKIIDGDEKNFKITTQLDYILAKELVKND